MGVAESIRADLFDVKTILSKQDRMERQRAPFDRERQDVARLCLPRNAIFDQINDGWSSPRRSSRLIDTHGVMALDQGAAVFEGLVMPQGSYWQQIVAADPDLMKLQHVAEWFEAKTKRLYQLRNDPQSGFVQQTHESVLSLLAFGDQSMWVDLRYDDWGDPVGLAYRSEHIGSIWIDEDFQGNVARTHRKLRLSARESVRKWGEVALAGCDKLLKAARDSKTHDNEFSFLHVIAQNPKIESGRADWKGKPFVGLYLAIEDKKIIDVGGYNSRPRTYSRLDKSPNQIYGYGRGYAVLPELRGMQSMAWNIMAAEELNAQPPLALPDDETDSMLLYGPRELNYGLVDEQGRRLVHRLFDATDTTGMRIEQQELRAAVDRAFFVDMFDVRQELKTHVTAAATMERAQEKGILLAPLGRQTTEWFSPMLNREIELMARLGEFDDMPKEVREAGGAKSVRYDNPLNRMKDAEMAAGYFRTTSALTPLFQADPGALQAFLDEYPMDRVLPRLAEINGIPASWRASDDERQAKRAAADQQAQAAALLGAAPVIAQTAKDLSVANGV